MFKLHSVDMHRKLLSANDVEISYLEKNPQGLKTIFFIHGNSSSCQHWARQYQNAIFGEYRLIIFDLPGHGGSSTIPSGDYSVLSLAKTMAAALNTLDNGTPYGLIGFSLGGNITAEMLAYEIKPQALVLLSTGLVGKEVPLDKVIQSDLVTEVLFSDAAKPERIKEYFDALPYPGNSDLIGPLLSDYHNTVKGFRPLFLESIKKGMYSDEISLIRSWNGSPLVLYGQEDKIINPLLLDHVTLPLWKNEAFKITDAGHLVNLDKPLVTNQLIFDYFRSSL